MKNKLEIDFQKKSMANFLLQSNGLISITQGKSVYPCLCIQIT